MSVLSRDAELTAAHKHLNDYGKNDFAANADRHDNAAIFEIVASCGGQESEEQSRARLGRLRVHGRAPLLTPNHIGITSRGVVPHLSQDSLAKHTNLGGVYVALEDFIEHMPRRHPPLLKLYEHMQQQQQQEQEQETIGSALRRFISLAEEKLLVLGARRTPPVPTPTPNSQTSMSIYTSVGFQQLSDDEYVDMCAKLQPDIVVSLGDIPHGERAGRRRTEKMSGRTERWTKQIWESRREKRRVGTADDGLAAAGAAIFAPILPIEFEQQSIYLGILFEDLVDEIAGFAFYEAASLSYVPSRLSGLPRLSLTEAGTPHALLREIELGMDVFAIPFIGAATDAGIALDFTFPAPLATDSASVSASDGNGNGEAPKTNKKRELGIDMWQARHATDLSPLSRGCVCFACTHHHRAYVQHLLSAKEMLAWVLLQMHNLHVVDCFFSGVRACLARDNDSGSGSGNGDGGSRDSSATCTGTGTGTSTGTGSGSGSGSGRGRGSFAHAVQQFARMYEPELPEKTGSGPRVRGYQYKSEGPSETRRNPLAFERFNSNNNNDDTPDVTVAAAAADLDAPEDGPAPQDANAAVLEEQGFAKKL